MPDINPGCRNILFDVKYTDQVQDSEACHETLYRKWRVEMVGCESTVYNVRTQKIFIEDKQAPQFTSFPSDRQVQFFDLYGSQELGTPNVYDACGHGPSRVEYSDRIADSTHGLSKVERTWSAEDTCGNRASRVQNILIFNNDTEKNTEYDYRNFNLYSFNQIRGMKQSEIEGRVASKEKFTLVDSTVGEVATLASNVSSYKTQCFNKKTKYMAMSENEIGLENSIVNGPVFSSGKNKSLHFEKYTLDALSLSNFLNSSIRSLIKGPSKLVCVENLVDSRKVYAIRNYLGSTCTSIEFQLSHVNAIDASKFDSTSEYNLNLVGTQVVYNTFYLKDYALLKSLSMHIPRDSYAIINMELKENVVFDSPSSLFITNVDRPDNVLFNFLNKTKSIVFKSDLNERSSMLYGSILAPNVDVSVNYGNQTLLHYGQLFARNLDLNNYVQFCNQFGPFKF